MNWLERSWNFVKIRFFRVNKVCFVTKDVILPILSSPGKYVFYCPGCEENHIIDTNPSKHNSYHTLTGTFAKPTIRASVLETGENGNNPFWCHSFVTDGKIEFLEDCTHHLAGKTVDLIPL